MMTQSKQPKRIISYTLFMVAAVLLANPMPLLLDIFPDVIAFALIFLAIRYIGNIVPEFDNLKDSLSKLILITAIKVPAFFLMVMIWGGNTTQRSIVAVFTLVFAVVECCFLYPFMKQLFTSFSALGEHHNVTSALECGTGSFALRPDTLEKLTLGFFLVRTICSCVPEMALVPMIEAGEGDGFNWNLLYPALAILGAIITLIFGIVWCCYFIAYMKRMKAETAPHEILCEKYVASPYALSVGKYRRIRLVSIFYIIAIFCSVDIVVDNTNFVPDILTALALLGSAIVLSGLVKRAYLLLLPTTLYGVASGVLTVLSNNFYARYDTADIKYFDEARAQYQTILNVTLLTEALLILTLATFFVFLAILARKELGEENLANRPVARKTLRDMRIKLGIATLCGCLTAVTSYLYRLTYLETKNLASSTIGYITVPKLDWFWCVPPIATLFWLGWSIFAFNRIREEAELNLPEK